MDSHPWTKGEDLTPRQREAWLIMLREQASLGRTLTSAELGERLKGCRDWSAKTMRRLVAMGYAVQVVEPGRRGGSWSTQAVADRIARCDVVIRSDRPKSAVDSGAKRKPCGFPPLTDDERDVVECNIGLVGRIVGGVARSADEHDDLMQAGILGLMRAVQTCDAEKGALSTHAERRVRRAIQIHIMGDRLIHAPRYLNNRRQQELLPDYVAAMERTREVFELRHVDGGDNHPADPSIVDPLDAMAKDEAIAALPIVALRLDGRGAEVIRGRIKGLTLEAIGEEIGLTKERVRQIEMEAIRELREHMAKYAS